jgi:hypothetical protein
LFELVIGEGVFHHLPQVLAAFVDRNAVGHMLPD